MTENPSDKDKPILDIENLRTWYPIKRGVLARTVGYVKAVDDVTLRVEKGRTLGLVGESGCGKTTLGRTILGLEPAHGGRIVFEGNDLFSMGASARNAMRKRMQIIFQDPISSLNPRMQVIDIVTEGMRSFGMVSQKDMKDSAVRILSEVGMSADALYRYPHEFSGGQCQRISIARALSVKPDFMVLDEAVSALDVSVQAQVVNLLIDLQEKYGMSYLFISHDLSVVSHIADHIAVMYLGKIVEYGTVADIIGSPCHPYTIALIDAVPVPGTTREKKILQGETPSPSSPPSGCPFHPRCVEAAEACRKTPPHLKPLDNRLVSCHRRFDS